MSDRFKIKFAVLLMLAAGRIVAQPDLPNPPANVEIIPAGYLVIAMDNDKQNLTGTFFNLQAYGLANALLQEGIPIKWAIRAGKAHNAVDFSATAERIAPSYVGPRMLDFRAGPFLVPDTVLPCGLSTMDVITGFGGDVAVFRLMQNTAVDVRYTLDHRPRIAVFNDGPDIVHTKILDASRIPDYELIDARTTDLVNGCYTFASEPHWNLGSVDSSVIQTVNAFLQSGGNFLAQCEAVETFENNGFMMTTRGITKINAAVTNRYHNLDLAYMQIHGGIATNQPGSVQNWVLDSASVWLPQFYRGVTDLAIDTFITVGIKKIAPNAIGGNMWYLGGHDYSKGGKPANFVVQTLEHANALRLYLNCIFVPAMNSGGVWANAGPDKNISSCSGEVILGCEPTGPTNAVITWTPSTGLSCTSCPNPVATPDSNTTYIVSVSYNNCVAYDTVDVTLGICMPQVELITDTVCPGICGQIQAVPIQGTPNYTYTWSDTSLSGPGPHTVCPTTSTTYFVTLTDANNQTSEANGIFIVLTPPVISVNAWPVTCGGQCDGIATADGTGAAPLVYQWSNGATADSLSGLCQGTYIVTVTDANGCSDTATVVVPELPMLFLNDTVLPVSCNGESSGQISVSVAGGTPGYTYLWSNGATSRTAGNLTAGVYTVTVTDSRGCTQILTDTVPEPPVLDVTGSPSDVLCFGGTTGSAGLTVSGGTPSYTYVWSNGSSMNGLSGLPAGTYRVTVTDANGCTDTISLQVNQPPALTTGISGTGPLCAGGSDGFIDLTVSGGSPAYTYIWSNGATSEDLSWVPQGSYTVTVTDANGCTDTAFISLTEPAPLAVSGTGTDVRCAAACDGSASVTATGGTMPLTYLWSGSGSQTTPNATGLCPGAYTVTVTDNNGCTDTTIILISEPAALGGFVTANNVLCNGRCDGSVAVSASGGTAPYVYNWDDTQSHTTVSATGLCAGNYNVTVTDANGCLITLPAIITEPPALTLDTSYTPADCGSANGTGTVSATGGTAPYSYLWTNAGGQTTAAITGMFVGNYTAVVTDANGCKDSVLVTINEVGDLPPVAVAATHVSCNGACDGTASASAGGGIPPYTYLWQDGATTSTLTGLCPGTYEVVMADSTGCKGTSYTVITEPPALGVSLSGVDVRCSGNADGSAVAVVSGGTPAYTYTWSNGATTGSISGLAPGTYGLTVTDANGCPESALVTITEPAPLNVGLGGTNVQCAGKDDGSVTASASGGVLPYLYLWNTGGTAATLSSIPAGTYTVTVTDGNGCTVTGSLTILAPSPFVSTVTVVDVTCNLGGDGAVSIGNTGGNAPYNYLWGDGQTTSGVTGLTAGSYYVTVTDASGCEAYLDTTVTEPGPIGSILTPADVSCFGMADGSISQDVSGGFPPLTFTWSSGHSSEDISGLSPGTYAVTVTDARGCTDSAAVTVQEPPELVLNLNGNDVSCAAGNDGSADLTVLGGQVPYAFLWSNGLKKEDLTGLPSGIYIVTVTDAGGCVRVDSVVITEPPPLTLSEAALDPSCFGSSDGSIDLTPGGGSPPYVYAWSGGQTTEDVSGLAAGLYSVTVTDSKGCQAVTVVSLSNRPLLSLSVAPAGVRCNGLCDGSALAAAAGGSPPYTYSWNDAQLQTTAQATGLCAGTYRVCLTDAQRCQVCIETIVTEPPVLDLNLVTTDENCLWSNGTATAAPSGGTPGYTYRWNDPLQTTTATLTGLVAGFYGVTVTDANGCSRSDSVEVVFTWSPTPVFSGMDVCWGDTTYFTFASFGKYVSCHWDFGDGTAQDNTCGNVQHYYGSPGIYTVRHAVADYLGCSDTLSITVTVYPPPDVCLTDSVAGCVPVTASFTNCTPNTYSCFWEFGDGATSGNCNPSYTYTDPGCYDVSLTVTDSLGCTNKVTEQCFVEGYPLPVADFIANPTEVRILNPLVNFIDRSTDPYGWIWLFGDGDSASIQNPYHTYRDTGSYWVTLILTNKYGCTDTVIKPITVRDISSIYIPNAFTPNGDGKNEWFTIKHYNFCEFEMFIFDRWGNEIYRTTDLKGWDGTANGGSEIQQEDVYVWLVNAVDCFGNRWDRIGHVTLVR